MTVTSLKEDDISTYTYMFYLVDNCILWWRPCELVNPLAGRNCLLSLGCLCYRDSWIVSIISSDAFCCCTHDCCPVSRVVANLCIEVTYQQLDVMIRYVIQYLLHLLTECILFTVIYCVFWCIDEDYCTFDMSYLQLAITILSVTGFQDSRLFTVMLSRIIPTPFLCIPPHQYKIIAPSDTILPLSAVLNSLMQSIIRWHFFSILM